MADDIRHARAVSPYFRPIIAGSNDELHGLTGIGADPSVGSEKVYVIGKQTKCGTDTETPVVTVPLSQLERGEIASYLCLANLASEPSGGLDVADFNSSLTDAIFYIKDAYAGSLDSTIWIPQCTVNSITLNVDDPEGRITRDIELSGDDRRIFAGANKCLTFSKSTVGSGYSAENYTIDISDPTPVVDPHNAGVYVMSVVRVRSGEAKTLEITTDYTYVNGTTTVTILSATTGDIYHVYWSAGTFPASGDPTSVDSDSICFLKAENVTILIDDGVTELELDRLSSLSLTVTFNRIDEKVLGNDQRILREVSDSPVTVDFSARVKRYRGDRAFMASLASANLASSVKSFSDDVKITVKIYNNADKDIFLIGYQVDNLSYTGGSFSISANEFGTIDVSAESDDVKITTTVGDL